MPVLITGAASEVGQSLTRRLRAAGAEVRAFCSPEEPVTLLRQYGAVCAVGSLLDEGHLETAMEQVHTVVHLSPGPLAEDAARMVDETATVVSASVGAGVRRFVSVSVPAAADADDPLRRALAEIEELVVEGPFDSAVLRASLVDSGALRAVVARIPLGREVLATAVAPVRPDDLAGALEWVDARRAGDLPGHVVLAADGPRRMRLETWMRAVGITPLGAVGRAGGRLRPGPAPLLVDALPGPWTSPPDLPSVWALAGITPHPPAEG